MRIAIVGGGSPLLSAALMVATIQASERIADRDAIVIFEDPPARPEPEMNFSDSNAFSGYATKLYCEPEYQYYDADNEDARQGIAELRAWLAHRVQQVLSAFHPSAALLHPRARRQCSWSSRRWKSLT